MARFEDMYQGTDLSQNSMSTASQPALPEVNIESECPFSSQGDGDDKARNVERAQAGLEKGIRRGVTAVSSWDGIA